MNSDLTTCWFFFSGKLHCLLCVLGLLRERSVCQSHDTRSEVKFLRRSPQFLLHVLHVVGDRGGWSSEGCSVVNSTAEATTCSCNHLTSFAILLVRRWLSGLDKTSCFVVGGFLFFFLVDVVSFLQDFPREEMIDPRHAQILTFITYIGCGVSAIFLAFTLLTYLLFE